MVVLEPPKVKCSATFAPFAVRLNLPRGAKGLLLEAVS